MAADFARLVENIELGGRMLIRLQNFIDTPSYTFGYSVNKVAYFFSTMTKAAIRMVQVLVLITLVAIAGSYLTASETEQVRIAFVEEMLQVVSNPIFVALGLLYLLQTLHKVMFRIDDIDTK